jgi:hypothetical protein
LLICLTRFLIDKSNKRSTIMHGQTQI